ncbi:transmembrane protein 223-like [Glandiceps talaboti]
MALRLSAHRTINFLTRGLENGNSNNMICTVRTLAYFSSHGCRSIGPRIGYFRRKLNSLCTVSTKYGNYGNASAGKKRFYYGEIHKERPPDTKVVKDVLLYENKNFTFHRVMGMFAIAQFTFWIYLSNFAYSEMRVVQRAEQSVYGDKGVPEDKKKKFSLAGLNFHLGSSAWRYGLVTMSVVMGSLIMSAVWMYSRRNVHQLVLRRGGQKCTVVPFGFFGRTYQFTVPLTKMTCLHGRDSVKSNLPIKVKGRMFFFLLDKQGKFYNARLFDFTAGMRRIIEK